MFYLSIFYPIYPFLLTSTALKTCDDIPFNIRYSPFSFGLISIGVLNILETDDVIMTSLLTKGPIPSQHCVRMSCK